MKTSDYSRSTPKDFTPSRWTRVSTDVRPLERLAGVEIEGSVRTGSAVRAFAGDDISAAKYYDFDKNFLFEMEPTSSHYETYDR